MGLIPELSPAARERVAAILAQRYAADELTDQDLEARLALVYSVRTQADLDAIVADIPATAVAALVPMRIGAFMSGVERRIMGQVPAGLVVRSRLGYVELDLTGATFAPGVTQLELRAFMGYVQVRLPAGVRVECEGHAIAGFFAQKGNADAPDGAPVVRLTGRAMFGFVECRVARAKALSSGTR